MEVGTIRMSSRGQIVIPQSIRELIGADEGTLFAVTESDDTVLLRKIETPSREEIIRKIRVSAKEGRKRLEKMGFTEEDLHKAVERQRARRE